MPKYLIGYNISGCIILDFEDELDVTNINRTLQIVDNSLQEVSDKELINGLYYISEWQELDGDSITIESIEKVNDNGDYEPIWDCDELYSEQDE